MKVEVHDRLEDVGAGAWARLHSATRLRSPFLSWPWQVEWARAFAAGRLEVWTVHDGERGLVGALPLYEVESGLLRTIGGVEVSDYLDLLAMSDREVDVWTALLRARAALSSLWELHAVPGESPTVTTLPRLGPPHGVAVSASVEDRCPVLTLPASWDAYLASLASRHRHELLRKVRRLEREVPAAKASVCRESADIGRRLDDFLRLHRLSRPGKARFMDATMESFFRRIVAEFSKSGGASLWFLDAPAGPIASFITLEWDGTVGLYNSGFDPDTARWSPGLVLLTHLLRDAIDRGRSRFDFLRGEERYKYEFGPTPEDVYLVTVAPGAARGTA